MANSSSIPLTASDADRARSVAVRRISPAMLALGLVIIASIAARAWLQFRTPLAPGINGAYYFVQTRAVLERGALGLPDLPLIFGLSAGLAKAIGWLSGLSLESSIVLAVKLTDSVLPPLVAVPVFFLVRGWAAPRHSGNAVALAAAAVVGLGMPALVMVGDFQKNSLGLLWLGAMIWALHGWMERPTRRAGIMALGFLGLAGLTHVGVFGTSVLVAGAIVAVHFVRQRGVSPWRAIGWLASSSATIAAVSALVLWKFDPARIQRLAGAFAQPLRYLSTRGGPGLPPPTGGGPGMLPGLGFAPALIFAVPMLLGMRSAWRRRGELPLATVSTVLGCALAVIILTGPWVQGDKAPRFYFNAVIPAVLVAAFAIQQLGSRGARVTLTVVGTALFTGAGVMHLARGGRPIISAEAFAELQELRPLIREPRRTLIVAMHGHEWWATWVLGTHIAQAQALRADDWARYDVLYLEGEMRLPFPAFGPPRHAPPGLSAPPGGPMPRPKIPADAIVLHRGPHWTLARVTAPPADLGARTRQ